MIIGYDKKFWEDSLQLKTPFSIIDSIDDVFYLGGSRRMKQLGSSVKIIDKTDYDFYVTYTIELEKYLKENGFKQTSSSPDYYDDEAILILELENVQVVLRKNAIFYKAVFESIDVDFYATYLWKRAATCDRAMIQPIFNQLFRTARCLENSREGANE